MRDGDEISLDLANRRIDLLVEGAELARRHAVWSPMPRPALERRGWHWLHATHVFQADQGCDLDFLRADWGA